MIAELQMKIVNAHLGNSIAKQGMLKEPNALGYIAITAEVERPNILSSNSPKKQQLLAELKILCRELRGSSAAIYRADIFDAFIIPPGTATGKRLIKDKSYDVHVAKFDIVILFECASVEDALVIRGMPALEAIVSLTRLGSTYMDVAVYKNPKRIDEVSKDTVGVFLFNYFYSEDTQTLLDVWEYTAGWWTKNANLTNSTPLQPVLDGSSYNLINHCRWDRLIDVLPSLIFKPSMKRFVLKNFTENNIVAMPILYRLA
jgi:hypothetical protein